MRIYMIIALVGLLQAFVDGSSSTARLPALRRESVHSRIAAHPGHEAVRQTINNASFSTATELLQYGQFVSRDTFWSRQQLECNPGWFLCPDDRCCQDGTNCVEGGCCDGTKEACGAEGCYDPKTETCCTEFSTYCPDPAVCVANGHCCPAGKSLCGEDDCYDPKTEVCCSSSSTHCEKGHDCLPGGVCCPTGEVRCGANGCYNPDTEVCCQETSTHCDKGYNCVADNSCCPSGQQPCGSDKCYDPKTDVCCTEGNEVWGCSKGFKCCNLSLGCYDPDTENCCAGGACPKDDSCCGKECCRSIATCGNDGWCTATQIGEPTTKPAESTTKTAELTTTIAEPTETIAEPTTKPTATNVPVLELPYTPLVLDETVKNLCLLMAGVNEMLLTYSIVRKDGGKCKGCCSGVTVPAGKPYAGERTSCDEAPFAKTYEALLPGAHLACVDAYENSFQGWWFGRWSAYTRATVPSFKDKSQFIVRVTGLKCADVKESDLQGCASAAAPGPIPKRVMIRDATGTPTSGYETQVIPSSVANSTNNLVIIPLGDLDVGTYKMQVQLSGSLSNVTIMDNMGDEVGSSNTVSTSNLNSGSAFQFSVSTEAIGVALFIETQQTKVNATWNIQTTTSTSTSSISATPTTSSSTTSSPTSTNAAALVRAKRPTSMMVLTGLLFFRELALE